MWRVMLMRGSRVFARADEQGELAVEGGRVEIRYKTDDGRAYRAAARNLEALRVEEPLLPDHHCAAAEAKPTSAKPNKSKSALPNAPEGKEILCYADGACSHNPGPAGAGVVMCWDDQRRELSEFLGEGTNNIAELTAILRALEATPDPQRPFRLYTDSSYAIGLLTKGWKAKANKELVATVRAVFAGLADVELFHVPGHAGVPLNERADELAVQAVRDRASTGWRDVSGE